ENVLIRDEKLKVPPGTRLVNAKELFNLRHASLRNAIERAFGILKVACCILHNFLLMYDPDEEILCEVDREILENSTEEEVSDSENRNVDGSLGEQIRDHIAFQMWSNYNCVMNIIV
ncbi:hypothetical protein LINGRAHAP2_LOCUS10398, partial [Linum grandiflorum]